eukprot:2002244-Rhodomonas_salina.1
MEGEVEVGGNACCAMVVLAHAWWVHSVLKKLFEALKWGASFLEVMEGSRLNRLADWCVVRGVGCCSFPPLVALLVAHAVSPDAVSAGGGAGLWPAGCAAA